MRDKHPAPRRSCATPQEDPRPRPPKPDAAPNRPEDAPTEADEWETQPVDITQVRRRSLPFGPSATSPLAAVSRATGDAHPGSGGADRQETVELNLGGARRRLVRFDPETGQPVAQPYWEFVPGIRSG